jgi:Arc/MetJ family transcription regulator
MSRNPTIERVHRTTVDLDVDAYERARRALGTRGYKDTVNEALNAVDRASRLRRGAELIRAGGLNIVTPEDLEGLRRPRH